jgi:hypothetical protein
MVQMEHYAATPSGQRILLLCGATNVPEQLLL